MATISTLEPDSSYNFRHSLSQKNEITQVHMCDSSTSLLILSCFVCLHLIQAWVQDGVVISGSGDIVYLVAVYFQSMVGRKGSLRFQSFQRGN